MAKTIRLGKASKGECGQEEIQAQGFGKRECRPVVLELRRAAEASGR